MQDNYALIGFKKFLDSISIDIWYNSEREFKEEYYTKEYSPTEFAEPFLSENGIYNDGCDIGGEKLWSFGFNRLSLSDYYDKYSDLEKSLLEEMELNFKITKDYNEVISLYDELCNWLNDRAGRIQYNQERDLFESDFVHYNDNFCKISFKHIYEKDIKYFYKELKNRLMQTYSIVNEEIPKPKFETVLKWEKDKVDLIELMAALVESNSISKDNVPVSKEYMAEFFSKVFINIDLTNFAKDLSQAKKRKLDKSPYLKLLVKTFEDFANKSPKTSK